MGSCTRFISRILYGASNAGAVYLTFSHMKPHPGKTTLAPMIAFVSGFNTVLLIQQLSP